MMGNPIDNIRLIKIYQVKHIKIAIVELTSRTNGK
jgi:hypothetical protein